MTFLTPIPTTRVGSFQIRERIMNQLQQDQLGLFRVQHQISSGRRIVLPSEDPPAAIRSMTLQRLIEQKGQIEVNLQTNGSFLAATDSSLTTVSSVLAGIRGSALGVAGTTSTQEQRDAVAVEVDGAIRHLLGIGNQEFRGRYLFAGSRTDLAPYEMDGNVVRYIGNERKVRSYSDLDVLFDTNLHGVEVFGGISEPVRSTVNLNPHLSPGTLLSSLNGGQGVSPRGAITVSDGTNTSIVDLSQAATIADVARFIEAAPPAGRTVRAEITATGLSISLDTAGGGNLTIREVGDGRTARELGIFNDQGVLTGPLVGEDLNPALLPTTPLADLLGTKASAQLTMSGANNDLVIQAAQNGPSFNNVTIQFATAPGLSAGNEYAEYDATAGTLTVFVQPEHSTARFVADAINAEGTFTARIDGRDAVSLSQSGHGIVDMAATAATSGGSGTILDPSGLQITNAGETFVIDLSSAETVEDALNVITDSGAGVLAEINETKSGINIRSRLSGADFAIGENGGQTATQLGLRTFTTETRLADLNHDLGVPNAITASGVADLTNPNTDLTISAEPATQYAGATVEITNTGSVVGNAATAVYDELTKTLTIDVDPTATTALTVRNAINDAGPFVAGLNTDAGPNDGSGLVTDTGTVATLLSTDFVIVASDGTELPIDVSQAEVIGDLLDLINSHPLNNTGTTSVTARLAEFGNGIELVDTSGGTQPLTVRHFGLSKAAEYLGLIPPGGTEASAEVPGQLTGRDVHPLETESVFNTLIRLKDALETGNLEELARALEMIDEDILRVNFARAENGARHQGLEVTQARLEDETVELKSALSLELDADIVEAISELTARQIAIEASLRTASSLLRLTILDFI